MNDFTPRQRKISLVLSHIVFCYGPEELWEYRYGRLEASLRTKMFEHLQCCVRCRDSFRLLGELAQDSFQERPELSEAARVAMERLKHSQEREVPSPEFIAPKKPAPGQIWVAEPGPHGIGVPLLVVSTSLEGNNLYRVIPFSEDTDFALYPDPIFMAEEALGFDCFLPLFNEWLCLGDKLSRYLGKLTLEQMELVMGARSLFIDSGYRGCPDKIQEWWQSDEYLLAKYLSDGATEAVI